MWIILSQEVTIICLRVAVSYPDELRLLQVLYQKRAVNLVLIAANNNWRCLAICKFSPKTESTADSIFSYKKTSWFKTGIAANGTNATARWGRQIPTQKSVMKLSKHFISVPTTINSIYMPVNYIHIRLVIRLENSKEFWLILGPHNIYTKPPVERFQTLNTWQWNSRGQVPSSQWGGEELVRYTIYLVT